MNKKTLTRICIALVIFVALFFTVKELTKPKVEVGSKTVEIIVIDNTGEEATIVYQGAHQTDAQFLADLLVELQEKQIITLELQGNQSDAYGRSIVMIMDLKTEDWNIGPWWVFDSTTNQDCLSAGFCSGIDATPIYDQDIFEFTFTVTFE